MYCEKGYLSYLLESNERIYIDTCSLMNTESMRLFIGRAEREFLFYQKKITVPSMVMWELKEKQNDLLKKSNAEEAIQLIEQFDDIFEVESDLELETKSYSHADAQILANVTADKAKYGQLVITSDRNLSKDAFALNKQESNKGKKIMVCHITRNGFINMCDCVNQSNDENGTTIGEPEVITIEKVVYVKKPVAQEDKKRGWWSFPVFIAGGFAGGIAFDRYAVPAIKKVLNAVA